MELRDFYFDLPKELIAQEPIADRQMSRLMVLDKKSGEITHRIFKDVIDYLKEGDALVLNDTRVIPARLLGYREDTLGKIEFILLRQVDVRLWEVILKPARKAKVGSRFVFGEGKLLAQVIEILDDGRRLVRFEYDGIFEKILDEVGNMPLPPYITKKLLDKERYQTVYSKHKGSAAAPTAGLHFTLELLDEIKKKGVNVVYTTLHVGLGTFRPVKTQNIQEHKMHSEHFSISKDACDIINDTKSRGNKVFAVGTTSSRVLETATNEQGVIEPMTGETDIFIYPGYKFKMVDSLITNFHLPESTLLMLVSAMAGRESILHAYDCAVQERYRFFSFGDAMLIN